MTNKMLICLAIAVGVAVWLYFDYQKNFVKVKDTKPPLPINQYTNGVADGNPNNIATRVNFRQQPVGQNLM